MFRSSVSAIAAVDVVVDRSGPPNAPSSSLARQWPENARGPCVDLLAPGTFVTSKRPTPGETAVYSGTAQAVGVAAGAAALELQRDPRAAPADVRRALFARSATRLLVPAAPGELARVLQVEYDPLKP